MRPAGWPDRVPSLGHRRWLLYPDYAEAGFGHVDADVSATYASYSVQWVVSWQARQHPAYVAWPAPGPFPVDAPLGTWSFQVDGASFAAAVVSVLRLSDATPMLVTNAAARNNGYGWNALGWDVAGVASGESYEVSITGVSGAPQATYTYVVRFLTCP